MNGKETIWNSQESVGKRTGGLPPQDSLLALYEKTIYQNDRNGFCIFKMTSEDEAIPQEARDGYCKDDKIHFSVKGYYLPAVSDVMLQLAGKWEKNKYGFQPFIPAWIDHLPKGLIQRNGSGFTFHTERC